MNNHPSLTAVTAPFAPVALSPETPPLTCARQLILERVHEMVKHEEGTRAGEDLEALHDMRVWSRRLREALEIFAFCFPEKVYDKLYERVRQVTKALGRAREADVAVEFFEKFHAGAEDLVLRFALEDFLMRLAAEQHRQRTKMRDKLDHKIKVAALSDEMSAAFQKLALQPPSRRRGPRTALRLARSLLSQRLQAVFAVRQAISGEDDSNGLHNLRIAVKKLRYALEALEFVAGTQAAGNLKFFKKLQTTLGDLHDRDVFIATVKARYAALQKKGYSDLLRAGYEKIFEDLGRQRHELYQEYLQLFGGAKLAEWRKLVIPALPKKTPVAETSERNGSLNANQRAEQNNTELNRQGS